MKQCIGYFVYLSRKKSQNCENTTKDCFSAVAVMSRQQIRVFSLAHGRTTNVKRERELVRRTNRHRSLTASLQSPPGVSDHLRRARERRGGGAPHRSAKGGNDGRDGRRRTAWAMVGISRGSTRCSIGHSELSLLPSNRCAARLV